MPRSIRFAMFFILVSAPGRARSWSGALVDAKCFAGEERNVSPHDTLIAVDRDRYQEIWFCSPNKKTKAFAVVERQGPSFELDSAGNAKAAEVVRAAGKKNILVVEVTGEMTKNTVKVDSIVLAKRQPH